MLYYSTSFEMDVYFKICELYYQNIQKNKK
jgi:hypothetical protein